MTGQSTEDWALRYQRLGWSVIPLRHREKRPLVRWEPYQRRAVSKDEIRGWFARWPDANLGVVTGRISGLVVLDVDPAHGGAASLARLEAAHGALPRTAVAKTGGGGRHFYFRHPGGILRNRVGLAAGIDLRGDGGYVVAPPSLHPSGRRYAWEPSRGPEEAAPAPMPEWLLEPVVDDGAPVGHPLRYWRNLVREGVAEGERNNTIASLAGHLLWHGIDPAIVLDLLLCWNTRRCRPPLSDDEVAQTVRNITRTHFRHRGETEPS
jgi:hypothetical protein